MTKLWIIITLSTYVLRNIHCLGLSVVDVCRDNLPLVTHIQGGAIWGGDVGNMGDFYNKERWGRGGGFYN